MAFSSKSNSDFLSSSNATLVNIESNTAMLGRLQTRSYSTTRLTAGSNKIANAQAVFRSHLQKRQEKLAASVKIQEKRREVQDRCVSFGTSLRYHFKKEPDMIKNLGLDVRWSRRNADFIEQTLHLYNRALTTPEILARLVAEGIEEPMLQSDMALIQEYEAQRRDFVRLKGECQELVEQRDLAIAEAKSWMAGLKTTLRAIYRNNPQALESVGILVRNAPRRKTAAAGTTTDTGGTGDTGTTNGTDTGNDTGTDTGTDAGTDTGTDTGTTNGTDTGTTTGTDTGTTTGTAPESPLDNGRETATPIGFSRFPGIEEEPDPVMAIESTPTDSQTRKNQKKRKKRRNRG